MKTMQNLLSAYTAELTSIKEKLGRNTRENNKNANSTSEVKKAIEHLISSLPTIILGLSLDNNIVLWNVEAEDVLGTDAENVMGLHISQYGIDWDWDKILDGIIHSRYHKSPTRVDDIQLTRPDGEKRFLGLTVNPLNGDNKSILGLTIIGFEALENFRGSAIRQDDETLVVIKVT